MNEKSWDEFRQAGLLWWVNRMLHLFGWSIVCETGDDGRVVRTFPAQTAWRGFERHVEESGFKTVTYHLAENMDRLKTECDS
jgi:hypothetical protein